MITFVRAISKDHPRLADLAFRITGASFVGMAAWVFRMLSRANGLSPPHEPEPIEMAAALLVFLSLSLGLALLLEGSGIVAAPPVPPRPWR